MVIFFNGKNPTLSFSEIRAVRSLRIAGECSAREEYLFFAKPKNSKTRSYGAKKGRSPKEATPKCYLMSVES